MKLKTLWSLMRGSGGFRLQSKAFRNLEPVHRVYFIGAAAHFGVLRLLHDAPRTFDDLAQALSPNPQGYPGLRAWLHHGCLLGELAHDPDSDTYRLRGFLASRLANPLHDTASAFFEALASFHHRVLFEGLARITRGETLTFADQSGELIARVSELLTPIVHEIIDTHVPDTGDLHLLEVGCGTGALMRHALQRNTTLHATGLELQDDVATIARDNLAEWGLAERSHVETADARTWQTDDRFDLITLYNLIYYIPETERPDFLQHLTALLRPGGSLIISSACKGGTVGTNLLDIWGSMVPEVGALPKPEDLTHLLQQAGLTPAAPRRMMPGEAYFLFTASAPS